MDGKSSQNTTASTTESAIWKAPRKVARASFNAAVNVPNNPLDVRATKEIEFSIKRQDDSEDVYITGVLALVDRCIMVDVYNRKLKLYTESGVFLSSTNLTDSTWGITQVDSERFATCGVSNQILLWKVNENDIAPEDKAYKISEYASGIHFNGTYYCVLHRESNAVTILDDGGRHVRKFKIKEVYYLYGRKVTFCWDIYSDKDTHIVYIPCLFPNSGILCVSIGGEVLQFIA